MAMQTPSNRRLRQPLHLVQAANLGPEGDLHGCLPLESVGWARARNISPSDARPPRLDARPLRQRKHLRQRRAVGHQVFRRQFVARGDHRLLAHPQADRRGRVAVKRQPLLIADGGQEQVQRDRLVRQPRGVLTQKTTINPRPPLTRRAADAVGNQEFFVDHGR